MAEPLTDTFAGEFVALLRNETCPLVVPPRVGVKLIVTVALAVGASVSGTVSPLTENGRDELNELMVTLLLPVFVNETVWLVVPPTWVAGNEIVEGDAATVTVGAVAEPDSDTTGVLFDALLVKLRLPVTVPPRLGANFTGRDIELPALMDTGKTMGTLKDGSPLIGAAVIVSV